MYTLIIVYDKCTLAEQTTNVNDIVVICMQGKQLINNYFWCTNL